MGPLLTLDFDNVQVRNAERARYLLGVFSKEEVEGRFAEKADPRLSDAREPTAHTHPASEITAGTMTGRLVVQEVNDAAGEFTVVVQGDGDGGYGTNGALMWRNEAGQKMGMLSDTANVSGDWGMFMLFGRSDSAFQRVGEWDIAARDLGGEARVGGLTCDFNPNADGGFGLHVFTRPSGGSLDYGLWVDGNLGVCVGSYANGYTPPGGGLIVPGYVGIGVDAPAEALEVGANAHVLGDLFVDGKIYATGGVDPPYVLCDQITRAELVARVGREVPDSKRDGAALFFNKDTKRLEVYSPRDGTFYDLVGVPLEGVPIMPPPAVPSEIRYVFEPSAGAKATVEIARPAKRQLKDGYHLDAATGAFYRIEFSPPNELTGLRSKRRIPATAEEAVRPLAEISESI